MLERIEPTLSFLSTIGCGLAAGVFFAFSTFVMRALGKLPPAQGIAAMQSINVYAINALFITQLFGTAILCVVLVIASLMRWEAPGAGFCLAGALSYLIGTIGVTIAFNVPRNNVLAAVDPTSDAGVSYWARYLREWGFWNHVRTISSTIATGLLVLSRG